MKPICSDNDIPSPEEVRATLDRMVMSDSFSRSPQLGAFLRFVVEKVLQGQSNRIKGYTIGVEVLRRDPRFDPQHDPIVRVEATRLRRTIERYYAGPGADDAIIIDLPRGSYVPTFRRRQTHAAMLQGWRERPAWGRPLGLALAAVLVLAMVAGAAWLVLRERAPSLLPVATALPTGNGMPTLAVETIDVSGAPWTGAISPASLTEKMRDAFSRFDTINVVADPKGTHLDYRLVGAIDYRTDQTASVRFRLIDSADGNIVWSQSFDRSVARNEKAVEDEIVTVLATTLLQSYGVIRSRDRARHLTTSEGDPRYRCILEAADALRMQDPASYGRARDCLERLTKSDPSYAVGFSFLAVIRTREYQRGVATRPEDARPLDDALRAARRSIELNPTSARAYVALMVVLFARGDVAEAFAAGDKALSLNPHDKLSATEYGARLVMTGEIERGMAMLRQVAGLGTVLPSWHHFYMFLGSYLRGDMREAAYQAGQITAADYPLGHLARALAAAANGDGEGARQAIERLVALAPAWRDEPQREVAKIVLSPELRDRLGRDLTVAGLPCPS